MIGHEASTKKQIMTYLGSRKHETVRQPESSGPKSERVPCSLGAFETP